VDETGRERDSQQEQAEDGPQAPSTDKGAHAVLRAKYLDYCSARMADTLLSLDPTEIYTLAEDEARSVGRPSPTSYGDAVALATGRVRDQLDLPDFEMWAAAYLEDPARFDPLLMGLWKSEEG